MKIIIEVPATSANLGSGFDVFGVALNLRNRFITELIDSDKTEIEVKNNDGSIPMDKNNIFIKSLKIYFKKDINFKIKIENNIPSFSGLGSSSTAVVAGVFTGYILNKIINLSKLQYKTFKLTGQEINDITEQAIKIEGHSDNVIPTVYGGLCSSFKIGNKTGYYRIEMPKDLKSIIIHPKVRVSTTIARKILPRIIRIKRDDIVLNISSASILVPSLIAKKYENLKYAMQDKLHQERRAFLYPGGLKIIDLLYGNNVLGASISGSGPSVIAIIKKQTKVNGLEKEIKKFYQKHNVEINIYNSDFSKEGLKYKIEN